MDKTIRSTMQKTAILDFLKKHTGDHLPADDILTGLYNSGIKVGKATVYRYLNQLEKNGMVKKYTVSPSAPACWQYIGEHLNCMSHYHLMCLNCGGIVHVDSDILREFNKSMLNKVGFAIDDTKTVFYGLCNDCRQIKPTNESNYQSEQPKNSKL